MKQAHATLAREGLLVERARIRAALAAHPELATPELETSLSAAPEVYDLAISYTGALLVADVDGAFRRDGRMLGTFFGRGATLGVGFGVCWGTAYLNYKIESIRTWQALFLAKFEVLASAISWSGLHGEHIGYGVCGALGTGLFGPVAGLGTFGGPV